VQNYAKGLATLARRLEALCAALGTGRRPVLLRDAPTEVPLAQDCPPGQ